MGIASYEVVPWNDGWSIALDSKTAGSYATKEAAIEAAAIAVSNAIKEGSGIVPYPSKPAPKH